jgi:organic radical activating enzyme
MADVYCSKKFRDLEIHVQSRLLFNCCKAWPERIQLDWLEKNPGKLFHTPTMIADRESMLAGKRSKSCDHGCYQHEDKNLVSARKNSVGKKITDPHPHYPLENLQISLSTDCRLTCAYCSSHWSTAWANDIRKNGEYLIDGYLNQENNWIKLWSKMKQNDRGIDSKFFNLVLKEISITPSIKKISILGGEPLLNNQLIEALDSIKNKEIQITSGLGVDNGRFMKIVDQIKSKKNISFCLSAESTNDVFEFVRYGARWDDFLQKIQYLKKNNISISFISTITNLTSFGIVSFYDLFGKEHEISYNPVSDRTFLQPNVLDDLSKKLLIESVKDRSDNAFFSQWLKSASQPYKDAERENLSIFLKEFSKRRNLKLDIFPDHFLKWLDIH